jgi:hypothetical protein
LITPALLAALQRRLPAPLRRWLAGEQAGDYLIPATTAAMSTDPSTTGPALNPTTSAPSPAITGSSPVDPEAEASR